MRLPDRTLDAQRIAKLKWNACKYLRPINKFLSKVCLPLSALVAVVGEAGEKAAAAILRDSCDLGGSSIFFAERSLGPEQKYKDVTCKGMFFGTFMNLLNQFSVGQIIDNFYRELDAI